MSFTLGLALGAALLAAWFDNRLGDARPQTLVRRLVHVCLSIVALTASVGLLDLVNGVPQTAVLAAVLAVFLPALVYAMLTGFWILRTLAEIRDLVGR
jgi:hypothetical protein